MIATQQKIYTFTEYLNYQDSTDNKYELFNGELISMPPASGFHALILAFLYDYLIAEIKRLNLTWKVMPATVGIRTDKAKSRIPDLMIFMNALGSVWYTLSVSRVNKSRQISLIYFFKTLRQVFLYRKSSN